MRSALNLPPLASLRAFEAVGRLRSFRKAGDELLITQSAVSHHIRKLEEALGLPLFVRYAKSIELTKEGVFYLEMVRHIFDEIVASTSQLRSRSCRKRIKVSLLPSFAANWLVGRLHRFSETHPHIEVDLEPTLDHGNLSDVDLCIRYGAGVWDGVNATLLAEEQFTPVLHPTLLSGGALREAKDLLSFPLLFTKNPFDWEIWGQSAGLDLRMGRQIQLTDYNIALHAATSKQGIAIGRLMMIQDYLNSGLLVPASTLVASAPQVGYWVVTPQGVELTPSARQFVDWLHEECISSCRAQPLVSLNPAS